MCKSIENEGVNDMASIIISVVGVIVAVGLFVLGIMVDRGTKEESEDKKK